MLSCSQASAMASAEVHVMLLQPECPAVLLGRCSDMPMHCSVNCKPTSPLRIRRTNQELEEGE